MVESPLSLPDNSDRPIEPMSRGAPASFGTDKESMKRTIN